MLFILLACGQVDALSQYGYDSDDMYTPRVVSRSVSVSNAETQTMTYTKYGTISYQEPTRIKLFHRGEVISGGRLMQMLLETDSEQTQTQAQARSESATATENTPLLPKSCAQRWGEWLMSLIFTSCARKKN